MPIVDNEQIVSLHTLDGVLMYQFLPSDEITLSWGRHSNDTANCQIDLGPMIDDRNNFPEIYQWLHWISVWNSRGDELYWRGPVYKISAGRTGTTIHGRDPSVFCTRTRVPINKSWDAVDPSQPAGELYEAVIAQHRLGVQAITRADPYGDRYDMSVIKDGQMVDASIGDMVSQNGLHWTNVAGVPLLGPMPLTPQASLGEDDFLGDDLALVRDGSMTYNDVLVRGPDNLTRARLEMGGLDLQTIVNVDNMFGVSNVDRAAYQYIKYYGGFRNRIDIQGSTQLAPDAPVSIDQLIPSARFIVSAFGTRDVMALNSVDVKLDGQNVTVQIDLETVNDQLPELATLKDNVTGANSTPQMNGDLS